MRWLLSPVMIGEVAGMAVMPGRMQDRAKLGYVGYARIGSSDVWVNELMVPGIQVVIPSPRVSKLPLSRDLYRSFEWFL